MTRPLALAIFGLSLSSSWGNGHATTYRALIKGLDRLGHKVLFLERDMPWYAQNRDLAVPEFCDLDYYDSIEEVLRAHRSALLAADAVIVGSYVPEAIALIDALDHLVPGRLYFYDIDTPVTLARLGTGEAEYLARRQIARFAAYFSFSGGDVLRRLEREFGARLALPLYCAADSERYRPLGLVSRWDLGYLGTYSPDRQETLERLLIEPARRLPEMRFVVAGPQYPESIDWPANVERIPHLAASGHARFYGQQRFTLNVTRADMIAAGWSPSVRLFEAAACGTPIISDRWRGLEELLPAPRAIRIAERSEDVVGILTGMTEPDRLGMANTARRIILEGHTGLARGRQLASWLAGLAPDGSGPMVQTRQQRQLERPVS
jgi:spore maturation protein CgeB